MFVCLSAWLFFERADARDLGLMTLFFLERKFYFALIQDHQLAEAEDRWWPKKSYDRLGEMMTWLYSWFFDSYIAVRS